MWERQVGTAAFQQADRGSEADAFILAQRVPPGAELIGILDLPCHPGRVCLSGHIVNSRELGTQGNRMNAAEDFSLLAYVVCGVSLMGTRHGRGRRITG